MKALNTLFKYVKPLHFFKLIISRVYLITVCLSALFQNKKVWISAPCLL